MISRGIFRRNGWLAFLAIATVSIFGLSCSNTKDSLWTRTFHNLSAHYNGYYNAGLKLEEGTDKLAISHEDKYDRILKVFQYANAEKSKAIYPLMDDAMKRTSNVIARHTIIDKNGNEKPNSEKWIDENWLLYGKGLFFKHDYFEAMEAFKYVEVTYKKETTRHLGSLWIAKTYLELTQLKEAEDKLDYLRNQGDFPKKNKWELAAVNADFYLQTKNYPKAIESLTKASILAPKREDRIRFMFILAQLHQQQEEYQKAFQLYTKVIKMNPKYEMAFNARINRARCFDANSKNGDEVKKELAKLQKDPKNKDFLDQIYYALAGLAKKEGKPDEEFENLNKSVRASTTNQNQKALSYLELAKIYFTKPDYKNAQAYYDSTVTNLSNDHPDYNDVLTRRNSLTKLIRNLNIIATEDSLQGLAKLTPEARQQMVDAKLLAEEEAKRKLQEEEQVNQIFDQARPDQVNQMNKGSGSNWYFYNTQAISFGFNEFTKKWGNRKLEDNWRRSNKESVANVLEQEGSDSLVTEEKEIKDPKLAAEKKKQDMLAAIPSTPEAMEKSTRKVIDAYYNAAMIYREQLNDLPASVAMFEELLQKYPDNKYMLQSYYQLYRIYAQIGNAQKSEYYKNIILTKHGDTEYAEIIRNPNYAAERASKKSNLEIFYEDTYRKYLNGEYSDVIKRKGEADVQFPQSILAPQFDFLKTLSIGKTQALPVFEASLNDIIRTYGSDPVKDEAQNILDYIHNTGGNMPEAPALDTSTTVKLFAYNPDTVHYVIIIFQAIGGPVDGNKLKNKIADFNGVNYGLKGLTMMDMMMDHRNKIMIIKSFPNKTEALSYNSHIYDNDDVYGNTNPESYQQYVISVNNLAALMREKKTDQYEDFYRMFYR
ncbi:MAG: tetratricopeptide repeat protein [Bacteroidetes bacterium]|nr:tetratricopeptide repeat protein [Bacteroidota bacterium]MBK9542109.1 tetratricopeptide repeat protein [Bacteroidota bacterium]MBP6403878.1 tetratricopeptide repeat protein [Bacteroidia bacterium]